MQSWCGHRIVSRAGLFRRACSRRICSRRGCFRRTPLGPFAMIMATTLEGTRLAEPASNEFVPLEPASLGATGLSASGGKRLVLKRLLTGNVLSGRQIAESLRLALPILGELLRRLKTEQLVVYKAASAVNDYDYELTPSGFERASRLFQHSGYHGPAPVPLGEYVASVAAQSPSHATPTMADLRRALAGLLIDSSLVGRIGEAISSIGALFLYGARGTAKRALPSD